LAIGKGKQIAPGGAPSLRIN